MGMQAGRLDRRVALQAATEAQNAYGEPIKTWATYATVWAEKRDLRGSERFEAQQVDAELETTWKIRYRDDVAVTHRISYVGRIYDITGIIQLGRRDALELTTRAHVALSDAAEVA